MTVIARTLVSIPERSAAATWTMICALLSNKGSAARGELESIMGIACALIASEAMTSAIVTSGVGARVRIYCLYGEDAIAGDDVNEAALPHDPTDGDWKVSLPCRAEDLDWVRSSLKAKSSRITARDMAETTGDADESQAAGKDKGSLTSIDLEKFLKL